ncbi:hypothetical protein VE03_04670 [Pseudogymnoascus sp. 23342-1-I1]|nr:hypothetical protein VE03_04670 [Pseudogymnoascus sp. 23342-1-I1]
MAPELKSKKRKAAANDDEVEVAKKEKKVTVDTPAKKRKTAENGTPEVKKSKATKAAPPAAVVESPKVEKATKKAKAAAAAPVVAEATEEKKGKKAKAAAAAPAVVAEATEEKKTKKTKADKPLSENRKKLKEMKDAPDAEANALKAKKAKEAKAAPAPAAVEEAQADSDVEMDDQTEALLKGFESGSDDEVLDAADEPAYNGEPIPELSKKARSKLAKLAAQKAVSAGPGTVYLGRIPHGFYEHEMRQYFKQFGDITQLRLSRNKKTGGSKHYAFIQFSSGDVAEIVSKTMDSYLLFGHILKCKVVPEEQVHAGLWDGANKRFKKVPWNKMEGRKLNAGLDEAGWEKRNAAETKRREEKKEKMKAIGYEFEAPALKSAKGLPKRPREKVVVEVEPEVVAEEVVEEVVEPVKAVEPVKESKRKAEAAETEEPSKKKQKKVKTKASASNLKAAAAAEATAPIAAAKAEKPVTEKPATRSKKAAAEKAVAEPVVEKKATKAKKAAAAVVEEKAEKPAKKARKSKA